MKILTNWSVPAKAPMKYVRKTAMATMMLAASAVGMTSCDSFTKNKGTNETYTAYDTTNETIPNISYNIPENILDRLRISREWWSENIGERGLYGATLYAQMEADCRAFSRITSNLARDKFGLSDMDELWYDDGAIKAYNRYKRECSFKNCLAEMDEKLFLGGEPTWQECSNYLDRQVANLDFLTQDDYEKYKSDVKAFEKAQEKHDEFAIAELLAYKQFKLDSLRMTHKMKEVGVLNSYETGKYLRNEIHKSNSVWKSVVPIPNWNPDMVD